jgi:hypothetical protein
MWTTTMRALAVLLSSAAAIRLALASRGGQYFDWDEHRYGFSTLMLERLRHGDAGGALDILFRYPDHPGFKILGLGPAGLHQAINADRAITDMRQPSGEWLPAFAFSLSSVAAIALTYALGRRAGASERESLLAAALMFASTSMLMHARHFLPYDTALALGLLAAWVAINPADRAVDSAGAGFLAGAAFSTYLGYWLLAVTVLALHLFRHAVSPGRCVRRVALYGAGFAVVPGLILIAGHMRNRPLLRMTRRFAGAVTHGEFAEGWSLPWAFFWRAEGFLLLIVLAGIVLSLLRPTMRAARWAAAAALVYAGLVLGSNVMQRFVVYDRLARPMWPFMCLAAAAGLARIDGGRWIAGRRAYLLYGAAIGLAAINSAPLITQRYPRDIVHEVFARYGADAVAFDMSLLHTADSASGFFFPAAAPGPAKRYLLVNARDIWFEGGPGSKTLSEGRVIATWRHPRQLPLLQYHGYTPDQRRFMRSTDASIRLIDRGAEPAVTIDRR